MTLTHSLTRQRTSRTRPAPRCLLPRPNTELGTGVTGQHSTPRPWEVRHFLLEAGTVCVLGTQAVVAARADAPGLLAEAALPLHRVARVALNRPAWSSSSFHPTAREPGRPRAPPCLCFPLWSKALREPSVKYSEGCQHGSHRCRCWRGRCKRARGTPPGPRAGCDAQNPLLGSPPSHGGAGRPTREPGGRARKPPKRKEGVQQGPTEPGSPHPPHPCMFRKAGSFPPFSSSAGDLAGRAAGAGSPVHGAKCTAIPTPGVHTRCPVNNGYSRRPRPLDSTTGTAWRGEPYRDPGKRSSARRRGGAGAGGRRAENADSIAPKLP